MVDTLKMWQVNSLQVNSYNSLQVKTGKKGRKRVYECYVTSRLTKGKNQISKSFHKLDNLVSSF